MKFWLENRFLVSTISFGLLLLALIVLIIIPSLSEIRLINKQVLGERIRLEKLYTKGQLQKNVKVTYEKVKANLPFLDEVMLNESQELQYITAVEHLATQENLELEINVGENRRVPEQKFSTLGFSFIVRGEWESIMKWIEQVENLHLYTNIIELSIAVREKEGINEPRIATLTMAADTYWKIIQQ
jgi:hypothetical protein